MGTEGTCLQVSKIWAKSEIVGITIFRDYCLEIRDGFKVKIFFVFTLNLGGISYIFVKC